MLLRLERQPTAKHATLGRLYLVATGAGGNVPLCWTLEDALRPAGEKVPGQTAIPAGTYPIAITFSPRFGRALPLIETVPGFTGIRIHPGNSDADTEGCLLCGLNVGGADELLNSRAACDRVQNLIASAIQRHELVSIAIVDPVAVIPKSA